MTVVEHIDQAIEQLRAEQPPSNVLPAPHARSCAIAITKLEEARMWTNRAFAEKTTGTTTARDVEREASEA